MDNFCNAAKFGHLLNFQRLQDSQDSAAVPGHGYSYDKAMTWTPRNHFNRTMFGQPWHYSLKINQDSEDRTGQPWQYYRGRTPRGELPRYDSRKKKNWANTYWSCRIPNQDMNPLLNSDPDLFGVKSLIQIRIERSERYPNKSHSLPLEKKQQNSVPVLWNEIIPYPPYLLATIPCSPSVKLYDSLPSVKETVKFRTLS